MELISTNSGLVFNSKSCTLPFIRNETSQKLNLNYVCASLDVTMAKDKEYDHPHYDDMVVETIRSQHKGKRGLTEKQILKHILKNYDVDKERAPSEVKHSIKRMTKSGKIVHYQFKYKMPTHPDRKE